MLSCLRNDVRVTVKSIPADPTPQEGGQTAAPASPAPLAAAPVEGIDIRQFFTRVTEGE